MKEIWKDVVGYEGLYRVSNKGRVKSVKRLVNHSKKGKRIAPSVHLKFGFVRGYSTVQLFKFGKGKNFLVHRLVALSFIENIDNKPIINHIDGDKVNNNLYNLEWVTASENQKHAYAIGLRCNKGENHNRSKLNNLDVTRIKKLLCEGELTHKEIADIYNISRTVVTRIKTKARWGHI